MSRIRRRKFLGASALAAALPTRIFAQTATSRPQLLRSSRCVEVPVASEAIPAAVRQFQSEIDAIHHEEEPFSVRATVQT